MFANLGDWGIFGQNCDRSTHCVDVFHIIFIVTKRIIHQQFSETVFSLLALAVFETVWEAGGVVCKLPVVLLRSLQRFDRQWGLHTNKLFWFYLNFDCPGFPLHKRAKTKKYNVLHRDESTCEWAVVVDPFVQSLSRALLVIAVRKWCKWGNWTLGSIVDQNAESEWAAMEQDSPTRSLLRESPWNAHFDPLVQVCTSTWRSLVHTTAVTLVASGAVSLVYDKHMPWCEGGKRENSLCLSFLLLLALCAHEFTINAWHDMTRENAEILYFSCYLCALKEGLSVINVWWRSQRVSSCLQRRLESCVLCWHLQWRNSGAQGM